LHCKIAICVSVLFFFIFLFENIATVFSDKGKNTNGLWMGRAGRWALNNRSPLGLKWTGAMPSEIPAMIQYFSLEICRL